MADCSLTGAAPEHWVPVPGYENSYEVSDLGRIRSIGRWATSGPRRFLAGRLLSPNIKSRYVSVNLYRDGMPRTAAVHRLVLAAFVGPCPEGQEGCHNDGNPMNNRLTNLRWDTRSGNMLDKVKHGTHHHAVKTHCPKGHPYDSVNTFMDSGSRKCRACKRDYDMRRALVAADIHPGF